jgi:hypothetical protein
MKAVTQITKAYGIQNPTRSIFREKMGQQSNARTVYKKYREHINEKDAFLWLSKGALTAETGSEIKRAQTK